MNWKLAGCSIATLVLLTTAAPAQDKQTLVAKMTEYNALRKWTPLGVDDWQITSPPMVSFPLGSMPDGSLRFGLQSQLYNFPQHWFNLDCFSGNIDSFTLDMRDMTLRKVLNIAATKVCSDPNPFHVSSAPVRGAPSSRETHAVDFVPQGSGGWKLLGKNAANHYIYIFTPHSARGHEMLTEVQPGRDVKTIADFKGSLRHYLTFDCAGHVSGWGTFTTTDIEQGSILLDAEKEVCRGC